MEKTKQNDGRPLDEAGAKPIQNNHTYRSPSVLQLSEYGANLLCPACRRDCTHVAGYAIETSSSRVDGPVTVLPGFCEYGHRFSICFGQHKGITHIWCESLSTPSFVGWPDFNVEKRNGKPFAIEGIIRAALRAASGNAKKKTSRSCTVSAPS